MAIKRPMAVALVAAAHLALGPVLVLHGLCCRGLARVDFLFPEPNREQQRQMERFAAFRKDRLPEYRVGLATGVAAPVLIGALLVAADADLLRMRRRGRVLSLLYAGLSAAVAAGLLAHQLLRVDPAVRAFFDRDPARLPPSASLEAGLRFQSWDPVVVCSTLVGYAGVVAAVLMWPPVARAFRARPAPR